MPLKLTLSKYKKNMPNKQIDPKHEAIRWLNAMFGIANGCGSGVVEMIVDNIIKAAVAEMKATTEQSSVVREEVQG